MSICTLTFEPVPRTTKLDVFAHMLSDSMIKILTFKCPKRIKTYVDLKFYLYFRSNQFLVIIYDLNRQIKSEVPRHFFQFEFKLTFRQTLLMHFLTSIFFCFPICCRQTLYGKTEKLFVVRLLSWSGF